MTRRQSRPEQWLIVERLPDDRLRRLPPGTGVLLVGASMDASAKRAVRRLARTRRLTVADEAAGQARRVHNVRELRSALLARTPLILLSPIHPTASHPGWRPLPRMRAAALARLGGRRLIALGGMDSKRYARVAPLGFIEWAGISAFRT